MKAYEIKKQRIQGDPRNFTLTPQERLFCEEYLLCFNKSEAARRAGFSPQSAGTSATRLLARPKVQEYLDELFNIRKRKYNVTEEKITEELHHIAFSDFFDMVKSFDGKSFEFKTLEEMPEAMRKIVKTFKLSKNGIEITLYDKIAALEALGKHIGYFKKDNEQKQSQGILLYIPDNGRNEPIEDAEVIE